MLSIEMRNIGVFMQFTLLLCIFEEYVTFSINLIIWPLRALVVLTNVKT
jgi:hypothetical protein